MPPESPEYRTDHDNPWADLGEFVEPSEMSTTPDAMENAYNALAWIHFLAQQHYVGQAFEPEHMRGIANLAAEALAGKEMPNFDEAMNRARASAKDRFKDLGLAFEDGGLVDSTYGDCPKCTQPLISGENYSGVKCSSPACNYWDCA